MKLIIFDLDDTIFNNTEQLNGSLDNIEYIKPFGDAIITLESLRGMDVKTALVSTGDTSVQDRKIDILGIRKYFDNIHLCKDAEDKKQIFNTLIINHEIRDLNNVYIVGDRIDREIKFGNELGCITIQMLSGKWKDMEVKDKTQISKYKIKTLKEILKLV